MSQSVGVRDRNVTVAGNLVRIARVRQLDHIPEPLAAADRRIRSLRYAKNGPPLRPISERAWQKSSGRSRKYAASGPRRDAYCMPRLFLSERSMPDWLCSHDTLPRGASVSNRLDVGWRSECSRLGERMRIGVRRVVRRPRVRSCALVEGEGVRSPIRSIRSARTG